MSINRAFSVTLLGATEPFSGKTEHFRGEIKKHNVQKPKLEPEKLQCDYCTLNLASLLSRIKHKSVEMRSICTDPF